MGHLKVEKSINITTLLQAAHERFSMVTNEKVWFCFLHDEKLRNISYHKYNLNFLALFSFIFFFIFFFFFLNCIR